jgi:tubulin-specific chaperone D
MAFGSLSKTLYEVLNVELIDTLIKNCVPKGKESDDAETRREAIKSLVNVA